METTLTVRIPRSKGVALERLARARRMTVSAVVRDILELSLEGKRSDGFLALAGSATSKRPRSPFRDALRKNNFRD
jgi:hypothetical protein